MTGQTIVAGYMPREKQLTFHRSQAKIRGYGGAVGGGKSRAICEEALRLALNHPGLVTLICRQAHTSIIGTTKKTMTEQVLVDDLVAEKKASGGEDWIKLKNGSVFHFIGLEDPVRWFSSEIGFLIFDEAHEVSEETVAKLTTRLRQRCQNCIKDELLDCTHMPNRVVLAFNPENPGHWLFRWFIAGASQTRHGFHKKHLRLESATRAIGDAEFVFATALDNPYLGRDYIEMLEGLPDVLRQRYLEGKWVYISGNCFFDKEALAAYEDWTRNHLPEWIGGLVCCAKHPACKCEGIGAQPRFRTDKHGLWSIWKAPVRERFENGKLLPEHRYIVAVDVSSGGSQDFTGIQVISVEDFEQVAEFQGKLDPDLVAIEAARIGRIYNDALVAPEITGGWGFSVVKELQRLRYRKIYTRPVEDRLSRKWTDKIGWDTTTKSRAVMLDTLERVLREREFVLNGMRTHHELAVFVRDEAGRPAAQSNEHDDLTISLAIGVTLASQLPRQLRRVKEEKFVPQYAATGW